MKIYNLFPPLAGPINNWRTHALRARAIGFDWLLVNPVCDASPDGGIYAVRNHLQLHSSLTDGTQEDFTPLEDFIHYCHGIGLKIMLEIDLLGLSRQSGLFLEKPHIFKRNPDGELHHPGFYEQWQVKEILAEMVEVDDHRPEVADEIYHWRLDVLTHYRGLGIDGVKIVAPWRSPAGVWDRLLTAAGQGGGDCTFVADTLGARLEDIRLLGQNGFHLVYNSSKYWDFEGDWCLKQYDFLRDVCGSISFPETHDTDRLINELNGDVRMVKMRYTFAALFSQALLVPMGFEYGFRQRLNSRTSTPGDWEDVQVDLTSFIGRVNALKDRYNVFRTEAEMVPIGNSQQPLFMATRKSADDNERALIIINTDPWSWQETVIKDLSELLGKSRILLDESPEYMMDGVPRNFRSPLRPAQVKVFCTKKTA